MSTAFHIPRTLIALLLAIILIMTFMARPAFGGEKEALKRTQFIAMYWDIVSNERMKALDILLKAEDPETLRYLYIVSYWDPELRIRAKAFKMLVQQHDRLGHISYLAGKSFRLERDPDLRADKATMMESLRYRWYALKDLSEFMIRIRYPKYGYPYEYGWPESSYPWDDVREFRRHPARGWVVRIGGGSGIGILHGWTDWDAVRDNRRRLNKIIHAINYLGDANFKLRYGIEKKIKTWWAFKSPEFKELDRREREVQMLKEFAMKKVVKKKEEAKVVVKPAIRKLNKEGSFTLEDWLDKRVKDTRDEAIEEED